LHISARQNLYAHLERENIWGDNIIAIMKVKADKYAGGSWAPGVIFYWGNNKWAAVRLGGGTSPTLERRHGSSQSNHDYKVMSGKVSVSNWIWLKLVLSPTDIQSAYSLDGVNEHTPPNSGWVPIASYSRFDGSPELIIVGKGLSYGNTYPATDFDNNYKKTGSGPGESYIDDIYIYPET